VLSRDIDVVKAVGNCGVPIFLFVRSRIWRVVSLSLR